MEGARFTPEQIQRQVDQLRLIYEPTEKYRFASVRAYYPYWNANNPNESLTKIATEHRRLYTLITRNLPLDLQPGQDRHILWDYKTQYFTVQEERKVYPQVTRGEIPHRLDDIIATFAAIKKQRDKGNMNSVRTISAFGTSMLTLVSLHGIIGGDGHGRASMSLIEPISIASGFPYLYYNSAFMLNGNFDLEMAYRTVLENNKFAALRMYAGHLHMNKYGDIPRYLRDPKAIWSPRFSSTATFRAAYDLASDLLLDRSPTETAQRPVV